MFSIDRLAALVYTMDVKKKGRNCNVSDVCILIERRNCYDQT